MLSVKSNSIELKSFLTQTNINTFNNFIIDKIDDVYFMSNYLTFIFFYSGGGLLEINFIDKLIQQNKYKKINIFIIDDFFYNLKKKILVKNHISNKSNNINCKIFSNLDDFYHYITCNPCRIDFLVGANDFYKNLSSIDNDFWNLFINKLVGSRGVYDKDIYILNQYKDDIDIKILSIFSLIN